MKTLVYADDIVIQDTNEKKLEEKLSKWDGTLKEYSLKIKMKK